MTIGRPHKPLLLVNAMASTFLALEFLRAMKSQEDQKIQSQLDNRYRLFYGAVFNLMTEYFFVGFASEELRDSFDISFDNTDAFFEFSVRPILYPTAGKKADITECHDMVDNFINDLQAIADDAYLDQSNIIIVNGDRHYDGHKIYEFKFYDTQQLLKLAHIMYQRINCISYGEADRYVSTVIESIESPSPQFSKLTRLPSIEYIKATLYRAQGRDAANENNDFYCPHYTH